MSKLLAVAILVASVASNSFAQSVTPPGFDPKSLDETVADLNRSLPRQVDAETRLDRVAVGPGARLTYSYTLINRDVAAVDVERFNAGMQPQLRTEVCGRPGMVALLRSGVSLAYAYRSNDGKFVSLIEIAPQHCKL